MYFLMYNKNGNKNIIRNKMNKIQKERLKKKKTKVKLPEKKVKTL